MREVVTREQYVPIGGPISFDPRRVLLDVLAEANLTVCRCGWTHWTTWWDISPPIGWEAKVFVRLEKLDNLTEEVTP